MKKYVVDVLIFIICFGVVYYYNRPEAKKQEPEKPKITIPQGNPNPQGSVDPQGSVNPEVGSQNQTQEQPKVETVDKQNNIECKNGTCTVPYYQPQTKSPTLKYYVDRRGRLVYFYQ